MRARRLVNLLNGTTAFGLAVARLGRAHVRRGPDGLLLAEGYRLPFPVAGAFTIGDVVITATRFAPLLSALPRVLAHESRHSRQWATLGPVFLPLYLLSGAWSWARTGDLAARNPFERAAGLADGGYRDVPARPLMPRGRRRGA